MLTTQKLLTIILLAILAQVAVYLLVKWFGHWRAYRQLHKRGGEPAATPVTAPAASCAEPVASGSYREFRVLRREYEDSSRSICSFYLVPADNSPLPSFKPGQYLTFQLPLADPASGATKNIVRCYSLSDRPDTDCYRVSIKRALPPAGVPDALPGVSSNHFHDHVHEGDVLRVKAPAGHFYLEPGDDPVVLIGGGIGITPMLSMLGASLRDNPAREVWLFYGVRNGSEQIMKAQLEQLAREHANFHLHVCYSRPTASDKAGVDYQHQGHVDVALLRQTLPLQPFRYYLCGPRALMESLVPALEQWGVPRQSIHYEAFGPASLPPALHAAPAAQPSAGPKLAVTFEKSGKRFDWDGSADYLLDFAEQHEIAVDSGCRAGGCGSCQTCIVSGEVEYEHAPDFDPAPGTCLLCIARPKTDLILSA